MQRQQSHLDVMDLCPANNDPLTELIHKKPESILEMGNISRDDGAGSGVLTKNIFYYFLG